MSLVSRTILKSVEEAYVVFAAHCTCFADSLRTLNRASSPLDHSCDCCPFLSRIPDWRKTSLTGRHFHDTFTVGHSNYAGTLKFVRVRKVACVKPRNSEVPSRPFSKSSPQAILARQLASRDPDSTRRSTGNVLALTLSSDPPTIRILSEALDYLTATGKIMERRSFFHDGLGPISLGTRSTKAEMSIAQGCATTPSCAAGSGRQ